MTRDDSESFVNSDMEALLLFGLGRQRRNPCRDIPNCQSPFVRRRPAFSSSHIPSCWPEHHDSPEQVAGCRRLHEVAERTPTHHHR